MSTDGEELIFAGDHKEETYHCWTPYFGEAITVPERDWGGIANGKLLSLAASEFDVLLTMDRRISFQQNRSGLDLCLFVLRASSNALENLLSVEPTLNAELVNTAPGRVILIGEYMASHKLNGKRLLLYFGVSFFNRVLVFPGSQTRPGLAY